MDITGFLSSTVHSVGASIRNWLERNGIRITVQVQLNGVNHNAIIVGPNNPEEHRPEHQIALTPLGAVALVGASALAVGTLIANPALIVGPEEDFQQNQPMLSDSQILMNCAEVELVRQSQDPQKEQENCSVCMDGYVDNDKVLILPCLHKFHKQCILPWLRRTGLCSVCRNPVNSLTPS